MITADKSLLGVNPTIIFLLLLFLKLIGGDISWWIVIAPLPLSVVTEVAYAYYRKSKAPTE